MLLLLFLLFSLGIRSTAEAIGSGAADEEKWFEKRAIREAMVVAGAL
jgi:hypothetical protein